MRAKRSAQYPARHSKWSLVLLKWFCLDEFFFFLRVRVKGSRGVASGVSAAELVTSGIRAHGPEMGCPEVANCGSLGSSSRAGEVSSVSVNPGFGAMICRGVGVKDGRDLRVSPSRTWQRFLGT